MKLIKVNTVDNDEFLINPDNLLWALLSRTSGDKGKYYFRFGFGEAVDVVSQPFPTPAAAKAWAATVGIEVIE